MIYFLCLRPAGRFPVLHFFVNMAKKNKETKLNSMRVLDAQNVPYDIFTYPPQHHSAIEVAQLAGVPPEIVYKTLVVQREQGKPVLVMIAGDRQLNLKRLAASIGEKRLRMASQREAERLTGLQVGGISPLALLNRGFDIFVDKHALAQNRVYVSAGRRGLNLCLSVQDLLRATGAQPVDVVD
jgi:Cys-tRNA(Pro)/Cys-tRNA(Cys) deacylase